MEAYHLVEHNAYLRYHDLPGSDPVFVFLHGLGSASSSCFPRVVHEPRLRDYRSLLVDFLGYGFSDRPAGFSYTMEAQTELVARFLRSLRLKRTIVVGHSMGGAIAVLLAAKHPALVSHLISAEGSLDPGPGFVSGPISSMTEEEFASFGHPEFVRKILLAGSPDYAGTVRAADPVALHRSAVSLIAERRPTYRELLYRMNIPRAFLFGEQSLPDPDVERLRVEGVDVRIIANAGHNMMADHPQGFADAVADAVEQAR